MLNVLYKDEKAIYKLDEIFEIVEQNISLINLFLNIVNVNGIMKITI